jgi:hypothetical protein
MLRNLFLPRRLTFRAARRRAGRAYRATRIAGRDRGELEELDGPGDVGFEVVVRGALSEPGLSHLCRLGASFKT